MQIHNRNSRGSPTCFGLLIALVAYFCNSIASATPSGSLDIGITSAKQQWCISEPVVVNVAFTNNSTTALSIPSEISVSIPCPVVFLVSTDKIHFRTLEPLITRESRVRKIDIKPASYLLHEEILTLDSATGGLVFPDAGQYFLRVDYDGRQSNILPIHIISPVSEEDKSWSSLFQSRDVLLSITPFGGKNPNALKKLANCPNGASTFSPYAAYYLGIAEHNKSNALSYLEKACASKFPLQSRAIMETGRLQSELGNKQIARQHFNRVLSEFPDSYAATQVRASRWLELPTDNQLSQDAYRQAVIELESEWYDVKGFWLDTKASWAREFYERRGNLYDRWATGKLSESERKRQEALLLKEYVRKYYKPIDPAEWKQRYESYAKREQENMAKHTEELQKGAAETERRLNENRQKEKR